MLDFIEKVQGVLCELATTSISLNSLWSQDRTLDLSFNDANLLVLSYNVKLRSLFMKLEISKLENPGLQ